MTQTFNVGSRSLFVTVTAWVFIALAAVASVSALVQNASVVSFMPEWQAQPLPLLTGLLLGYLPWVVGAGFAMSVATLACAIGLLVLAIVANLAGLWLQHEVVQSVVDNTLSHVQLPQAAAGVFGGFVTATRVMALAMTLSACAMLGWIIRRLMSATVRQEFA